MNVYPALQRGFFDRRYFQFIFIDNDTGGIQVWFSLFIYFIEILINWYEYKKNNRSSHLSQFEKFLLFISLKLL